MSSEILLMYYDKNGRKINEKSIKRPSFYRVLKQLVEKDLGTNSFDMFYYDFQTNKKIYIRNNEEYKKSDYIINIAVNQNLVSNVINNKKENEFSSGKEQQNHNQINCEQNDIRTDITNQNITQEYNFSRYTKCPKVALKNLGNTSYLNSVLQCLNSSQEFVNHNLKPKNMKFMEDNVKIMPLSFTISRLFKHFYPYPENDNKYIYEAVAI